MLQINAVDLTLGSSWSNQRDKISKSVTCKVIEGVVEEFGETKQDYIYIKRCYVFGIVVKEGDIEVTDNERYREN